MKECDNHSSTLSRSHKQLTKCNMIVGRLAGLGHAAKAEFIKHGKQDGKTGKAVGM